MNWAENILLILQILVQMLSSSLSEPFYRVSKCLHLDGMGKSTVEER